MFQSLAAGWADLVLPGTSYLERDGTYVNLEGRLQRLRRSVIPPAPDELAWISKLAERFDVEIAPYASAVFAELSERIYDGLPVRRGRRAGPAAHAQRGARGRPARAAGRAQGQGPAPDPLQGALLRPRGRARPRARSSSGRRPRSSSRRGRRVAAASRAARPSASRTTAPRLRAAGARQRRAARRVVRIADEHAGELGGLVERGGGASDRSLVDLDHQGVPDHQPAAAHLRLHDAGSSARCSAGCSCATAPTAPARSGSCSRSPTWSSWSARRPSTPRARSTSSTSARRCSRPSPRWPPSP